MEYSSISRLNTRFSEIAVAPVTSKGNIIIFSKDIRYMGEHSLNKIADFLREKSRLSFTGHKMTILRRRLETRLAELDLPGMSDYWRYLNSHAEEPVRLFDLVTTNETSFFRNQAQFTYLKEQIIPGFLKLPTADKRKIRILCAGCSTGEEPYSIAMTLLETVRSPDAQSVEIIAGDLSPNCLRIAKNGCYEAEKLSKLPVSYQKRFLTKEEDGYKIKAEVKNLVCFVHLNLDDLMNSDCPSWNQGLGLFEIIFCRNVMIYFAPSCQQKLVDTLHRLLKPGGYLFTGDAEPLHLFSHEFKPVAEADCLIYQKME
jgi:chemotaxis protein methyltransferase CheR